MNIQWSGCVFTVSHDSSFWRCWTRANCARHSHSQAPPGRRQCFHRKHATHSMYQFKLHPACTCTCCQRAPSCVLGMPSVITTAANSYHRLIEKIYSGQDFFFRKKFHTRTHLLIIMHAMLYSKRFPCIRVHISAINVHTCFELHPTTSSLTLFIHMLVTLFVFLPPPLSIFFFPFP